MGKRTSLKTSKFISFIAVLIALIAVVALGGCNNTASLSSSSSASASSKSEQAFLTIKVGTLATEDILPLWVAQSEKLFADTGIDLQIVKFQSATELIAGVSSKEVDLAMTDIMVSASIFASDVDIKMEWVTLGTDPSQGRFGIMVGPNSEITSLKELAGIPIGVGSNTILEYVLDMLMEDAGVPANQITVYEIQKLPVRYQAIMTGDVAAAALPGTLLALGEHNGCRLIADDTTSRNISQSVMIARTDFAKDSKNAEAIEKLKEVWNTAAKKINNDPEAYRSVLVKEANLPQEISNTYKINNYPEVMLPTAQMVDPVLSWMKEKSYLNKNLTYDEKNGTFSVA